MVSKKTSNQPPHTYCIRMFSILIHTGKGGGGKLNQREGWSGNRSQSLVENTNMLNVSPVMEINTCPKAPLQVNIFI
jgi:hypothetical protein